MVRDDLQIQSAHSLSIFCKWKLRNIDRRVAQNVPNIFFKLKTMHMKQISDKVMLALKRCKTKGKQYTVREILHEHDTIVKLDDGYKIFKTLRNSPPYLEKRQKDLMAMIRQLGCPTYFVSLSAADTRWIDLLRILGRFIDKREYPDDELENMDWTTKTRLVQSDPVTCVRFFDHRLQTFIHQVLKGNLHPIGCIKDFFVY